MLEKVIFSFLWGNLDCLHFIKLQVAILHISNPEIYHFDKVVSRILFAQG